MNWVTASICMFFSSVSLYLFLRKSNLLKTPQQLNNLAMFVIPLILFSLMSYQEHTRLSLSAFEYFVIVIQAIFFSYLGNLLSLKGLEKAPNPGYSLIISKSFVVFTSVASIFIFNDQLTTKSLIAIGLIILFSALIVIDRRTKPTRSDNMWLVYTFGAFFCWGLLSLSSKYLLNLGVPILARLIYLMSMVTMLILGEIRAKKISLIAVTKTQLFVLLMLGIFSASFNYFMQIGITLAPNVGYVNAANASSISLVTLLSSFLFKDELSPKKLIGIAGVTLGLIVLFL